MHLDELIEVEDSEPHSAALNMAIDEVLLRSAQHPMLRIYQWANPAVSFGYFGHFSQIVKEWPGRELVRRWTGGGVVAHGEDLTYSLVVPRAHALSRCPPLESYRWVHAQLAEVLREAGLSVRLRSAGAAAVSANCFESPVAADLEGASGAKVAGAAQRRTRHGLLHQGSVLLSVAPADFGTRMRQRLARGGGTRKITSEEMASAAALALTRYGSPAWTAKY